MTPDLRKFARANYPCSITVWRTETSEVILANTANISAGGLCVFLNHASSVGDLLEVKIDAEEKGLNYFGEVVRCREDGAKQTTSPKQKFYETAIKFCAVDDKDRQDLVKFVQKLIALEKSNKPTDSL
jgi:hypothetical protein